ncbi:MAG TPA: hypothetical protein VE988_04165, partial [Gemmataceae bacterium]|nr:hypothetical protein [Gemmataceae bacterium]
MKSLLTTLFRYMRFSQGSRRRKAGASRANQRTRPWLEALEDRMVPSTLSIADVTVREGPTTLDVLDPAGATALNLDHPRNIVFNDMPGSSHYHDL